MAETIVKEEEEAAAAQPGPDQDPAPRADIDQSCLRRTAAGDIHVSLESFPYYLCEATKEVLRSAAHLHLVCKKKFAPQHVPSLSQLLRLYGPSGSEIYQETLAMALAKQFDATLLIYDPLPQPVLDSSLARDEDQVVSWKHRLDRDAGALRARRNNARIRTTLELIGWSCIDLETNRIESRMLSDESVSRVVGYAVMHHLESKKPGAEDVLSSDSIGHGFSLLEAVKSTADKSPKKSLLKDVAATANVFEKKLLDDDVVPPEELGVGFEDVGGLEGVKDALRESVMLPLRRPELFSVGQLRNPCEGGILLFGPPGTGKTLLARAVAAEAGANFINLSMSSSRWCGEGAERYAKAAFALASKIAPSVVFVDDIDDVMSSSRGPGEHRHPRRALKNEFMTNWDGLRTKKDTARQVLILAASNRPFDLDEHVLRRFPRRLMVGLPDSSNREKILRVILCKEELAPDVDLAAVANMTDGYSGRDLKELCVAAARCAIREVLEKEGSSASPGSGVGGVRAFKMDDFRYAREHVGAGTSSGSADARKLGDWSNRYGEGGSRKKQVPSYFL